ncbi:hypothetical protein EG329_013505 [Mollisiaceae sp. DMI_Dod_QoI]|nr:hypothetical protein EG329_013505 [Helotiales sp. DMI_Dod_QoI]
MQATKVPDILQDSTQDSLPIIDASVRETGFPKVTKDSEPHDPTESELLTLSRDGLTKAFELAPSYGEDQDRPNSLGSSIMRYISSSELEADYVDIETALRTASLEDLGAQDTASMCMRLPSLKHKTASIEPAYEEDPRGDLGKKISSDAEWVQCNKFCDRCKDWDLECDLNLPCLPCGRSGVPCSNDPMRSATHFDTYAPLPSYLQRIPYYGQSSIPGQKNKPMSEAHSVGSSGSYSTRSTHSARYSLKLNRRLSANNRRHSATDIRSTPPSSRPSKPVSIQLDDRTSKRRLVFSRTRDLVTDIPQIQPSFQNACGTDQDDGRAEYFSCPVMGCREMFRISVESHFETTRFGDTMKRHILAPKYPGYGTMCYGTVESVLYLVWAKCDDIYIFVAIGKKEKGEMLGKADLR